jgi:hypothetical protein
MDDFDWMREVPNPHDLAEEYRKLKVEAAENQRYAEAAEYRDMERELLELPKFDSTEAWLKVFNRMTESGEMMDYLKRLGEAYER